MNKAKNGLRKAVQGYLSPDLLDDYIRLTVLCVSMGALIGFASVAIHEVYLILQEASLHLAHVSPLFVFAVPVAGLSLAYILVEKYSTTRQSGGGSHRLLEAYHYEGGIMTLKDTVFEPLASAITIGTGGSAGFEGPSLLLGGGIGSLIAQRLNFSQEEVQRFLISGAAAGVAAIFKAPLTGIMFALEIPYKRDLSRSAFIPATLSSISAYLVAVAFEGSETIFPLLPQSDLLSPVFLLHAFVIGVVTSVFSVLFVRLFNAVGELRDRFKLPSLAYPVVGGLIIGLVGYVRPQVIGVGQETVKAIISGEHAEWSPLFLFSLILLKMILTAVTLKGGGSGGVFIPSLFVGAALGAIYTGLVNVPSEQVLIVAAMASMIAAANKTLLTSVAFVAETAGPSGIVFTLVAAATSYFISRDVSFYEHVQPMDELQEEEEAVHVLYHIAKKQRDQEKFKTAKVKDFMSSEPVALKESMRVKDALEAVHSCKYRRYPIIRRNKVVGITSLEDLLTCPPDKSRLQIGFLYMEHPEVVTPEDSLEDVLEIMIERDQDCVVVVNDREKMNLVSVINEADVMSKMLELM